MRELIIDSFAGGGGASTGIELALGRPPDIAINHDGVALAMHEANHPGTRHLPHDIWKVDPREACGAAPVGLLWASPDCKHFSKAKGGKPVEKSIRDLAWVVVRWARLVKPRVIMLENVEEFATWGPLATDGRPCPDRKGITFKRWARELIKLGYKVEYRELRACDYGAPTIRKRLFLVARRDGLPIVWPAPTHGDPKSEGVKAGRLKPWRTAAEIIDWSLPCPSIFLTRAEGRAIGVNRPLAPATMARIAKGIKRYVIDAAQPFIVPVKTWGGGGNEPRSVDEPTRTSTASKRGEQAVVTPFAIPITHVGDDRTYSLGEPLRTLTTAQRGEQALVTPYMVRTAHGEADKNGKRRGRGEHSLDQPFSTVLASNDHALVAPHVMTMRNAQKPHTRADEPAHTVTAGGAGLSLVAAFLAQHNISRGDGLNPGREATEPVSTILQSGSHQSVVAAGLVNMRGTADDQLMPRPIDSPAATISAQGGHQAEVRAFLTKYYGADQDPRLEEPLHTATAKARFGLVTVTIDGEPYVIADIGMRMLQPRELFRAQGFPDGYIIDRRVDGTPITKTDQVRMCGNSVCPPMAEALVRANYQPMDVDGDGNPAFALEAAE